jgi:hypothetical protein
MIMNTLQDRCPTGARTADRRGFALPAAILALAVVAILLTGGFHFANQEQRVGMSSERATQAFYMAEHGLGQAMTTFTPAMAGNWSFGSPVTVNESQGSYTLRAMRVDERLYYIESTGTVTGGAFPAPAQRTLGMLIRRNSADIEVEAALTTQGGVELRGNSEIHGVDRVPTGWDHCPITNDSVPGVIVGDGGSVGIRGGNEENRLTGDPPWTEDESVSDETFNTFGDMSWADLVAQADIVIPTDGSAGGTHTINDTQATLDGDGFCDRWNMSTGTGSLLNWGYPYEKTNSSATLAPCHDWFPIIYVNGNARIQSNGYAQGILLVDGDVDLRGNFNFFGIIIAQGQLQTQGGNNPRIVGGAIARNADLDLQTYVGSSVIQYSSCVIGETISNASGMSWMAPLTRRSWVDLTGASF